MKKASKWIAALLALVLLLVVVAIVLPFLIDFNRFKPQIQNAVAEKVNAQIDFESARLQIFPAIGIKITKVTLINTDPKFRGTKLFAVDSLLVDTKLLPLLGGKIEGQVIVDRPQFILAKDGLANNLSSLSRNQPGTAGNPPTQPTPSDPNQNPSPGSSTPSAEPAEPKNTMAMIKEKVLIEAVRLKDAEVTIRDLKSASEPLKLRDLDVDVTNIGLERDIAIVVTTRTEIKESGARVSGPIRLDSKVWAKMLESGLELAKFEGKLSFDDLDINARDAFVKRPGIPLNVAFKGEFKPNYLNMENVAFNLHNLQVLAKVKIKDLNALALSANITATNDNLASLGDILPQHKNLLMNGTLKLDAAADGEAAKPDRLQAGLDLAVKLTGSDFNAKLDAKSLIPFKGNLALQSSRLDVDALLKPFKKDQPEETSKKEPADQTKDASSGPAKDASPDGKPAQKAPNEGTAQTPPPKDFELSPELKAMLAGTDAHLKVDFKQIVAAGTTLTDLVVDANQKNLVTDLKLFGIDGFGGQIRSKGQVNLGESPIAFSKEFHLSNVQPEALMAIIKPEHKDVLKGRVNVDLTARGRGTTLPTLNKTLNGQGQFKFLEGQINTPSIASAITGEFDKFVSGLNVDQMIGGAFNLADKLLENPMVKASGKAPPDLKTLKAQYMGIAKAKIMEQGSMSRDLKNVSGKFEIKDGRVYINSQNATPAGTVVMNSSVGLDMSLAGTATFSASESTKQKLLAQSKYASVLFDNAGNLVLPAKLGGTATHPQVGLSMDQLRSNVSQKASSMAEKEAKQLAEQYLKQLLGGKEQQLKDQAKKKVDELIKQKTGGKSDDQRKKLEEEAKKKLKGLF